MCKERRSKINKIKEQIEDSTFKCGECVDVLKVFVVSERMHCTNDVEKPYYSGLVDSTAERPPVCYSCGDDLNEECFKKYIEQKKSYGKVGRIDARDLKLSEREKLAKRGRNMNE